MRIRPVTAAIGAEIEGVDLGHPLRDHVVDDIYRALVEHHVIFFRDQDVSPEAHLAFAECFGDIDDPHPLYRHVPGFDRIVMLANDAHNPPDTDGWHTDLTFKPNPPFSSILVAREVPEVGGDTMWSSMCAAYDALPDGMKADLAALRAVHDMGDFRNSFVQGQPDTAKLEGAMSRFGMAIHPAVMTHPVSGRRFLYVNEGFTQHIEGLTARASRRLLSYLFDHINRPEYQVRFRWRNGSVVMWDNRCTQHYAVADYLPAYRCMNRVTVVNDRRVEAMILDHP